MTQHQHTQGPWRVSPPSPNVEIVTDRPTANETESIVQFKGQRNALANARFIVRACNATATCWRLWNCVLIALPI